jgi:hypothetical protein
MLLTVLIIKKLYRQDKELNILQVSFILTIKHNQENN